MAALICNRCGHEADPTTENGSPCEYTYPSFNGKTGRKCNGTVKAASYGWIPV